MSNTEEPLPAASLWRGEELFQRPDFQQVLTPPLTESLARIAHDLEHGSGAVLVRGLPLGDADPEALEARLLGLASALGTPVPQTPAGDLVLRVQDEGYAPGDPRFRGPHSSRRLSFHTDRCDVIGFLCVRPASEGGENDLLSSVALYDELLREAPEAARTLREPYVYKRHVVDAANELPYTRMPVFSFTEGRFAASLLRVLIDRADADPNLPSVTDAQRTALDTLEAHAEHLYARLRLEPGDLLLLNNWTTFHRRRAFTDGDPPRLLLRVWLSMPNSRPIAPAFRDHFGAVEAGTLRGGFRT